MFQCAMCKRGRGFVSKAPFARTSLAKCHGAGYADKRLKRQHICSWCAFIHTTSPMPGRTSMGLCCPLQDRSVSTISSAALLQNRPQSWPVWLALLNEHASELQNRETRIFATWKPRTAGETIVAIAPAALTALRLISATTYKVEAAAVGCLEQTDGMLPKEGIPPRLCTEPCEVMRGVLGLHL